MSQNKRCFVGAAAPEYVLYTLNAQGAPGGYLTDLSFVSAVTFDVYAPGAAAPVVWTTTIESRTATQLVVKHAFAADGSDVPKDGTYTVYPRVVLPAGTFPAGFDAFVAARRASPAGAPPLPYPGVVELGDEAPAPGSAAASSAPGAGYWGDGFDGVIHYSADTVLTRDVRAVSVLVDAGVSVDVAGFEISAQLSITNNGTIHQDGKPGDRGTGGVGGGTGAGGTASCDPFNCTAGIGGGPGGSGSGGLGDSSRIIGGSGSLHDLLWATGGVGGTGDTPSGGGAGGAPGSYAVGYTVPLALPHAFAGPVPTHLLALDPTSFSFTTIPAGTGGGGGGGPGGGGGGGGAGLVRLRAPSIVNNGVIRARGGAGGAGAPSGGGGGGGGGGGRIVLVGAVSGVGTTDVSGGAGGAASGTGATAGAAGAAGSVHTFT